MIGGQSAWASAFAVGIRPKERLTVSTWADKNRVLTSKTSAEPGPWRTSRTPYLREIMDELSDHSSAQKVIMMGGAQVGKTETGNNWIGYTIDDDPSVMMVVWPSLPDVLTNSKLRITPLIENTPCLKDKIMDHKGREEGSSARFRNFDGGALILAGANSASGLKSIPAKKVFLDEVDSYPDDVEGEGDPVALVFARQRTFSKRKAFLSSTPTDKGKSKIEKEFRASDQRYYYVPCPHCKELQTLNWEQISYETDEDQNGEPVVTSCSYFCKHCGEEIPEHFKTWMLSEENGAKWIKHNPKSQVPGFHISALYSPLGWYSWRDAAQDYVNAGEDQEKLKVWTNTVLGMTYEMQGEAPDFEKIKSRCELYSIGSVPRGVVFLTASIDVQKDRFEVLIQGWGRRRERWLVEHKVIPADTDNDKDWDLLEDYLATEFKHVDGQVFGIYKAGIDSGYQAQKVYNFCKRYDASKVLPLKGRDDIKTMIGTTSAVDLQNEKTGKRLKKGVRLWHIGVNIIKDELFADLNLSAPDDIIDGYPAGFLHYPQLDEEFFRQLTAEKRIISRSSDGKHKSTYIKTYERNEVLDLHVYARAIASVVGIDRLNESGWQRLESQKAIALKVKKKENEGIELKIKKKIKHSDFWDD
jgi:phage terminase large subunit GpA-like protein